MGFRTNSYATVWEVEAISPSMTKARISISKKNRNTGDYETDFSGFVTFVGQQSAQKALLLKAKDRIKLGDVDVTNSYNKEKNVTYTNLKVFTFEPADATTNQANNTMKEQDGDPDFMDLSGIDGDEVPW